MIKKILFDKRGMWVGFLFLLVPCYALSFQHDGLGNIPDSFTVHKDHATYRLVVTPSLGGQGITVNFSIINLNSASNPEPDQVVNIPDSVLEPLSGVADREKRLHLLLAVLMTVHTSIRGGREMAYNSLAVISPDTPMVTLSFQLQAVNPVSRESGNVSAGVTLTPHVNSLNNSLVINIPDLHTGLQHHFEIPNIDSLQQQVGVGEQDNTDTSTHAVITQEGHHLILGSVEDSNGALVDVASFSSFPWYSEYLRIKQTRPAFAERVLSALIAMSMQYHNWYPCFSHELIIRDMLAENEIMLVGFDQTQTYVLAVTINFSDVDANGLCNATVIPSSTSEEGFAQEEYHEITIDFGNVSKMK